jgi:predicted MFS family arabinose efflux permease
MAGYSVVAALLPQFIDEWGMTNTEGGWFAGMVFGGYMLGVLPLVSLTDRIPSRSIYLASSALNALSCFGGALSSGLAPALVFRAAGGIAIAGMYMPGLRALTDGVQGRRRARIAAFYISSFTIGVSLSFLIGHIGLLWGWRGAFIFAGMLGAAGLAIAWMALPQSRNTLPKQIRPKIAFGPAFRNRDALVLTFAYAAAIWGSAGLRQWIVAFLTFCATDAGGGADQAWSILMTGAVINLLGVPAALLGNELSIRFGLKNVAMMVFLVSGLAGGLFGLTAMLPYIAVVWLSLLVGFIAQCNFANLTAGILTVAEPRQSGPIMGIYSCIGFAGGFLGTIAFGIWLDLFGGTGRPIAWFVAFAGCGFICLAGAAAIGFLGRRRAAQA